MQMILKWCMLAIIVVYFNYCVKILSCAGFIDDQYFALHWIMALNQQIVVDALRFLHLGHVITGPRRSPTVEGVTTNFASDGIVFCSVFWGLISCDNLRDISLFYIFLLFFSWYVYRYYFCVHAKPLIKHVEQHPTNNLTLGVCSTSFYIYCRNSVASFISWPGQSLAFLRWLCFHLFLLQDPQRCSLMMSCSMFYHVDYTPQHEF